MPCSDGGYTSEQLADMRAEKAAKDMSDLSALLCSTCRELELRDYDFDLNPAISVWWNNHKKEDERREAAKIRKQVQAKLAKELTLKAIGELTEDDKRLLRKFGYL